MAKFPIYLDLSGKRVVVVGTGAVAAQSIHSLSHAGGRVVVVAQRVTETFEQLCDRPNIELIISIYSRDYLAEAVLAVAATNDPQLNERIYKDCQQLEVLCHTIDNPQRSDFCMPEVLRRGPLLVTAGTEGTCGAYPHQFLRKLDAMLTDQHEHFVAELESAGQKLIEAIPSPVDRKHILTYLARDESFEFFRSRGPNEWRSRARTLFGHKMQKNR